MTGLSNHLRDPLNLILLILVVLSLVGSWQYVKETPGLDYYVAWVAADAVNNDTPHNIYDGSTRYTLAVLYRNKADEQKNNPRQKQIAKHRNRLPMTATPFMYWVTGLLATGDYERDLTFWQAFSLLLFITSILVSCRLLGYSLATTLVILMPVVIMFAPLHSDLRVGNVNSFQLGAIGLILWLQSRSADNRYLFATGFMISLLAMFKPNLAPIALLFAGGWAVRGQYSRLKITLSGMATGAFIAVLVSSWWMGNATVWLDWLDFLKKAVGGGPGGGGGNYSIMTQVSGGLGPLGQLLLALFLCLLCLVFFWWGRRSVSGQAADQLNEDREMFENSILIAMGCIVALLASALVWLHYYLLTIPMILIAFRPWRSPGSMKFLPILMLRVLPVIALLCLLDTEIRTLLVPIIDGRNYWVMATMTSASILFVIGLWQFGYGIRDQRDPTGS